MAKKCMMGGGAGMPKDKKMRSGGKKKQGGKKQGGKKQGKS